MYSWGAGYRPSPGLSIAHRLNNFLHNLSAVVNPVPMHLWAGTGGFYPSKAKVSGVVSTAKGDPLGGRAERSAAGLSQYQQPIRLLLFTGPLLCLVSNYP